MKPLAGIRLLSLCINLPGPVAVARLRQMGAETVKIEPPGGDPVARSAPGWYQALHEGIEIRQLDLKTAAGQDQLRSLLAQSDLLVTSTRPAALRRLGLAWSSLQDSYPGLCQVALIGYLAPDENKPGHDLTYQAPLGLLEPPYLPRTLVADLAGAEWAVSAALSLLLARERARAGGQELPGDERYAQVALAEAAAAFSLPLSNGLTSPGGLLGGGLPGYNLYRTRDGWVAIAALEPHFLERLTISLGLADLTHKDLAAAMLTRPSGEWERWAAERDLPLVAVING